MKINSPIADFVFWYVVSVVPLSLLFFIATFGLVAGGGGIASPLAFVISAYITARKFKSSTGGREAHYTSAKLAVITVLLPIILTIVFYLIPIREIALLGTLFGFSALIPPNAFASFSVAVSTTLALVVCQVLAAIVVFAVAEFVWRKK